MARLAKISENDESLSVFLELAEPLAFVRWTDRQFALDKHDKHDIMHLCHICCCFCVIYTKSNLNKVVLAK